MCKGDVFKDMQCKENSEFKNMHDVQYCFRKIIISMFLSNNEILRVSGCKANESCIYEIRVINAYHLGIKVYDCYAICNHIGKANYGHYYSYCKIKDNWYNFNDNNVSKIDDTIINSNAYCLFYIKKSKIN